MVKLPSPSALHAICKAILGRVEGRAGERLSLDVLCDDHEDAYAIHLTRFLVDTYDRPKIVGFRSHKVTMSTRELSGALRTGDASLVELVQDRVLYLKSIVMPDPKPRGFRLLFRRLVLTTPPKLRRRIQWAT